MCKVLDIILQDIVLVITIGGLSIGVSRVTPCMGAPGKDSFMIVVHMNWGYGLLDGCIYWKVGHQYASEYIGIVDT